MVYGAAYAGKAYFQVNPSHAAIFALAAFTLAKLGQMLSKHIERTNFKSDKLNSYKPRLQIISSKVAYISPIFAISVRFFSPHQTIVAIALTNLCADAYHTTELLLRN